MSGGGSNKAADQARADEQARMASITNTQGAINGVFNSPQRAKDIGDFVDATRQYYGQDLDKQKALADRQLKFSLARGGLTGGSTQVDRQSELGRDYVQGELQVDRKARGAGADLEAADQDSRARLIQLATSGLDSTTAAEQAAAGMRSSLEAGKSAAQAEGLGDAFGSLGKYFQSTQDAAVRRQANTAAGFGLYQPNPNFKYGG